MEIIKNNYRKDEELIEVICPYCGSLLRCTSEERDFSPCPVCGEPLIFVCEHCGEEVHEPTIDVGMYGLYYIKCPYCDNVNYLDDGVDVTVDNLELKHFNDNTNAVKIDFLTIKKWIREGINVLKNNPNRHNYYVAGGDGLVLVTKDDENYWVIVSNNYKDAWLKG